MTFYLKYRPQKVSELDLDQVREALNKIIGSPQIPHAFLFSGPKGAGKTSTARILAKAVNCLKPEKSGEPCNECEQCLSINRGSSMDVIEIDAASHRGVDDIRALRETIKLAPAGSKKKVYIIDEAHMLTTEAANALLKTLEEPPSHALFILATTAPEKLPDTIRSRSTMINFYKGSNEEILQSLEKVVKGEKIKIEDKALQLIVAKSDGSFREAHKLLEQASLGVDKVTQEKVSEIISGGELSPQEFLGFLAKKQAPEALGEIENLVKKGINLRSFAVEAVGLLRNNLLNKLGITKEGSIDGLSSQDSQKLIELLSDAIRQMPTSVIAQLPLELVVAKWVEGKADVQSVKLTQNTPQEIKNSPRNLQAKKENEDLDLEKTSDEEPQLSQDALQMTEIELPNEVEDLVEKVNLVQASIVEDLDDKWREIMRATKTKNHSVEALLRACKPAGFDGKSLQVEVFYKFHKDRLETAGYRSIVEDAASEVLSIKPIKLVCILSQTKRRAADVVNITIPQEEEVVKLAEEIFGATSDGKVH